MATSNHVGSLLRLLERWNVPVYAHPLERPYLIGRSPYPPPDPLVGGGAMRCSLPLPRGPIDVGDRLEFLQEDGYVPSAPSWRSIFTPGHSPGHVSLFRGRDRVLMAGDAVTTTRQELAIAVANAAARAAWPARLLYAGPRGARDRSAGSPLPTGNPPERAR